MWPHWSHSSSAVPKSTMHNVYFASVGQTVRSWDQEHVEQFTGGETRACTMAQVASTGSWPSSSILSSGELTRAAHGASPSSSAESWWGSTDLLVSLTGCMCQGLNCHPGASEIRESREDAVQSTLCKIHQCPSPSSCLALTHGGAWHQGKVSLWVLEVRLDPPESVVLLIVIGLKLVAEDFDSLLCLMLCAILHLAALGFSSFPPTLYLPVKAFKPDLASWCVASCMQKKTHTVCKICGSLLFSAASTFHAKIVSAQC